MRILLIILSFVMLASGVSAQVPAKINLRNAGPGKIALTGNKTRATIDLSKDVTGCAFAGAAVKKTYKDCAANPAEFRLIDATAKNSRIYLLISTGAAGNCNVCGQCGAADAFGLIRLTLDRRLRVVDKKSIALEFCLQDTALVSDLVDFNEETQEQSLKLVFENDVLAVDFEKSIIDETGDRRGYEFSHLEYNRKTPENGFVIKTEKREKSSIPEQ